MPADRTRRPDARTMMTTRLKHRLVRLPSATLLALIRTYQRTLSPALPVITAGACGCRFLPTCSHYAADAIRTHGAWAGGWLAVRRIVKCTPLHPGGFDPVPEKTKRPRDQETKRRKDPGAERSELARHGERGASQAFKSVSPSALCSFGPLVLWTLGSLVSVTPFFSHSL